VTYILSREAEEDIIQIYLNGLREFGPPPLIDIIVGFTKRSKLSVNSPTSHGDVMRWPTRPGSIRSSPTLLCIV